MLILIDFDETLTIKPTYRASHSKGLWQPAGYEYCHISEVEIAENLNSPTEAECTIRARITFGDIVCIISDNPRLKTIEDYLTKLFGENFPNVISEIRHGTGHLKSKFDVANELAKKYEKQLFDTVIVSANNWKEPPYLSSSGIKLINAYPTGDQWFDLRHPRASYDDLNCQTMISIGS